MIIEPINETLQRKVRSITNDYIRKAGEIFELKIQTIPVSFNLKGRAAGVYRVQNNNRHIRYNPYIFAKYFDNNLVTTVPHEVAHYVTDIIYGLKNIKPHGTEWQQAMLALGAIPQVTANYDLAGIPTRRTRHFTYQCHCSTHKLSSIRHNKIIRGAAVYYCRKCSHEIRPEPCQTETFI